jgi:peroxiredoxin
MKLANQSFLIENMALTESTMLKLNSPAPDFSLVNVDGATISKADFAGKPMLVMFICNHCPYVIHLADKLAAATKLYTEQGIGVVAIQANDVEAYPADNMEKMKEEVTARGYTFPYCLDETQEVAKSFTAACTPDFFLFDADHKLVYRGRFDETRPKRIESGVYDSTETPPTGAELNAAVDALLAKEPISATQLPSLGCNVKWKPGNEPDYFGTTPG